MKLFRFGPADHERPGVVLPTGQSIDVTHFGEDYDESFFASDGPARLAHWLESHAPACPEVPADARFGPCVKRPSKIMCVGLNYAKHAAETNAAIPAEPILFYKSTTAICGPNDNVVIPKRSEKTDWEVELAIVIQLPLSFRHLNVKGVYNCLFATIPHFKANGVGVVLNMASVASSVGIPDRFAYSMSKGAVLTMTLSVAKDYLSDNIRCNCISPARVHTPFVDGFLAKSYPGQEAEMFEKLSKTQPIGRMAEPKEVGALALYLCSDEAGFVTGCDYPLDGGFIRLNN